MLKTDGQSNGSTYAERAAEQVRYAEPRGYGVPRTAQERPLGDLFQELSQDVRNLVSLEVDLAKAEVSEKAGQAGKAAGFVALGGFVVYAGFLAIIFAVIAALASFIPLWLSALIVGVVVALIGYAVVRKGMNDLKPDKLAPRRTMQSIKENKEWVQDQVR